MRLAIGMLWYWFGRIEQEAIEISGLLKDATLKKKVKLVRNPERMSSSPSRPTSGSRRTWRQSDARRGFQACRRKISSTAKPHRQTFARRKEWRRLSTPIDSAGCRQLSPIRLCLTGGAPTSLRSSTPSCAAPPSQRRSQLSFMRLAYSCEGLPSPPCFGGSLACRSPYIW